MKKTLQLQGLDCAACAGELEEEIAKIEGITECSVIFMTQKLTLEYQTEAALEKAVYTANHFEEVQVVDVQTEEKQITLQIEGLDCAGCAAELEEEIVKIDGITKCSVIFMTQKIELSYTADEALEKAKYTVNHFEEVKVIEDEPQQEEQQKGTLLKLQNLHCAACAAELQEEIEAIKGVKSASVDFVGQRIYVNAENDEVLRKVIKTANHFEKVKVLNANDVVPKKESHLNEILQIVIAAVLFGIGMILEHVVKTEPAEICAIITFIIAYLAVGYPVLISTGKNIIKGKIFDENFLMTLASIGAMFLSEFSEAVEVMLLYQIGELLQSIAVGSSRRSISDLMDLRSETATVIKEGKQLTVKPEELKVGDTILVKAGEKIPVDAVITQGATSLDTKSLTGEGVLREVGEGAEVLSGCINAGGNIYLQVQREYTDSAVAKILDMVENSASKKAQPEKFITKFAKYYTPIVCCLALFVAAFVPLIIGIVTNNIVWDNWADWIQRALTLLVISCPCALIISIPLTYFGGIGAAARYGILVKGATYLDDVAKVTVAAFDKTGTLTKGDFNIVNVVGDERTLSLAAAAESGSSHPLAKPFALIETTYNAENVTEVAGKGVKCSVNGKTVLVGNAKLLQENGVEFTVAESVSTVIYVAEEGKYLGYIEIDDQIKPDVPAALKDLKSVGVTKCVMVTGDNPVRAQKVATELGDIDEVCAGLLPDEKLTMIEELKKQGKVLYVGDGINDAPVMSVADCSYSMGKIGSGAAIEASDIVIVSDNVSAIPQSIRIAKKTKRIVLQNLIFSIVAKVFFMVLGLVGVLPLWLAVFGDVGVMLLAVLNSMRMRLKIK